MNSIQARFIKYSESFKQSFDVLPPVVQESFKYAGAVAKGAGGGYLVYHATRFVNANLTTLTHDANLINPVSYMIFMGAMAAINGPISLMQEMGRCFLGERQIYENFEATSRATIGDRLRQRSWKVVAIVEQLYKRIDDLSSKILGIRSYNSLMHRELPDEDLFFMEIFRRVLIQQIRETTVLGISARLVIALNFPAVYFLGDEKFFILGLAGKMQAVYNKIKIEATNKEEEARTEKSVSKAYAALEKAEELANLCAKADPSKEIIKKVASCLTKAAERAEKTAKKLTEIKAKSLINRANGARIAAQTLRALVEPVKEKKPVAKCDSATQKEDTGAGVLLPMDTDSDQLEAALVEAALGELMDYAERPEEDAAVASS